MSAFGTFPYYAPPRGLLTPWGVAPNPTLAAWQGCRRRLRLTPTPQPLSIWSPPTCKGQAATRFASQALTGFLLRPLRIVSYFHGDGKGSRAAKPCILPLMPWNRPRVGVGGLGLPPAPAASQVRVGFGAKPQVFFLVLGC